MQQRNLTKLLLAVVPVLMAPGVWAGTGEPLSYNKIDEIPSGPGLFSKHGENDGITLSARNKSTPNGPAATPTQAVPDEASTREDTTGRRSFESLDDAEYEEFLRWLEYRKQKIGGQ